MVTHIKCSRSPHNGVSLICYSGFFFTLLIKYDDDTHANLTFAWKWSGTLLHFDVCVW